MVSEEHHGYLFFLLCIPYCAYLFVDTVVRRGYEKRV